jgi:hypothetical protein
LLAEDSAGVGLATTTGGLLISVIAGVVTIGFTLSPESAQRVPQLIWAALPIIPISVAGHLLYLGLRNHVRAQYLRTLEQEMRQEGRHPAAFRYLDYVSVPVLGRPYTWIPLALVELSGLAVVVGTVILSIYRLHAPWLWLGVGIDIALLAMLAIPAWVAGVGFAQLCARAEHSAYGR